MSDRMPKDQRDLFDAVEQQDAGAEAEYDQAVENGEIQPPADSDDTWLSAE